jgi:rhamnose transport system permease protein
MIAGLPVPSRDLRWLPRWWGFGLVLGTTIYGRQIYQIGTNEVAARYAGHPHARHQDGVVPRNGVCRRGSGMIFTSRLGSGALRSRARRRVADGADGHAGGTYIFGGRRLDPRNLLAAWLLSVISTGMTTANLLPATQLCVLGVLLIVSIVATNLIYSRTQR